MIKKHISRNSIGVLTSDRHCVRFVWLHCNSRLQILVGGSRFKKLPGNFIEKEQLLDEILASFGQRLEIF